MLTRRGFLAGAAPAVLRGTRRRPPNIVFVLIDDMGWRDVGYNGSRFYETPHIDRLAGDGMRFTNGYASAPVCSPTRAALMTGKHPARLGLTRHLQGAHRFHYSRVIPPPSRLELPLEEVTLAEMLHTAGYRSAAIGKWHLGDTGFLASDQGFDVGVGGDTAGSTNSFFYPEWKKKIPLEGARDGEYLTDRLTGLSLEFMRESAGKPFFLYLPHFAVHVPIQAKAEYIPRYEKKVRAGDPQNYPTYAAMVQSVDESVGRVRGLLDELKLAGDTIVVFTSDNGGVSSREWQNRPVTSNLPLRAGKGHLYEGGIRVPTVVHYPGVTRAGSVCEEPVSTIDFAPTLTGAVGLGAKALPRMDGLDLRPLLEGKPRLERDRLYWHFPHYSPQLGLPSAAVRERDWKLIRFFEDGREELFNLRDDLGETRDLARQQSDVRQRLSAQLTAWLKETGALLPVQNSNYDPAREREAGAPMGPVPPK
ncbi:MAG: sulfatase [Acidobacteria bacterium]|nr:sulfatase [Acidobacteriota bacterium]